MATLTVTSGKSKVGEGVMVGVNVMAGVNVGVGVEVSVGVKVYVGVKVSVGIGVFVHMAAVVVWVVAVMAACSSGEGPQAETRTKRKKISNDFLFIFLNYIAKAPISIWVNALRKSVGLRMIATPRAPEPVEFHEFLTRK
jgi:hypothetical protein